jgi:diguanylate cyclase (GGDEF)-like protein
MRQGHPCGVVSVDHRSRPDLGNTDPVERRIRRFRWLLAGSFAALGALVLLRLWMLEGSLDIVILGALALVGAAGVTAWQEIEAREARRRAAAEDMARILHGFSRAVSPDGIVEAILAEVGSGTGADHLVVVQRRPGTPILDVTLVATRKGGQASSTFLPASDLEPDPPPGPMPERRGSRRSTRDVGPARVTAEAAPASVTPDDPGDDAAVGIAVEPDDGAAADGRAGTDDRAGWEDRAGWDEPGGVGVAVGPGKKALVADETSSDVRVARASLRGQSDPAAAAAAVAARVEVRVRRAFGISHTLAVPLVAREEILGVIVISRRRMGAWPDGARRILEVAAGEAAAALARVHSLRDAQAQASTDPLTGLPNRRYFEEYVELLGRGRRAEDALGILMVDVDRFKAVNDRYGHAIGDVVLRAIGRTIATAVRELDVPARFGGEEFVVLLRNPSPDVALEVGERIRDAVARIDLRDIGVGAITVSVGASVSRSDGEGVATLVERADHALYRAKRYGRNRVEAA